MVKGNNEINVAHTPRRAHTHSRWISYTIRFSTMSISFRLSALGCIYVYQTQNYEIYDTSRRRRRRRKIEKTRRDSLCIFSVVLIVWRATDTNISHNHITYVPTMLMLMASAMIIVMMMMIIGLNLSHMKFICCAQHRFRSSRQRQNDR